MEKETNESAGTSEPQVFELTMDNPEDQDELNRRLRKPAESTNKERPSEGESMKQSGGKTS